MTFDDLARLWSSRGPASLVESLQASLLIPLKPWPGLSVGRTTLVGAASRSIYDRPLASADTFSRVVHTRLGDKVPAAVPVLPVAKSGRNPYASVTVGRAPTNDVVIDCKGLSRFHAEIRQADGGYRLRDADSRNGTTLNGAKVMAKHGEPLEAGDVVSFGEAGCVFVPLHEDALQLVFSRVSAHPRR